MRPIDMLGIAGVNRFQYVGQGCVHPRNGHEMNVIGHQTVGEYLRPLLLRVLLEEIEISLSVRVNQENVLSAIAALCRAE